MEHLIELLKSTKPEWVLLALLILLTFSAVNTFVERRMNEIEYADLSNFVSHLGLFLIFLNLMLVVLAVFYCSYFDDKLSPIDKLLWYASMLIWAVVPTACGVHSRGASRQGRRATLSTVVMWSYITSVAVAIGVSIWMVQSNPEMPKTLSHIASYYLGAVVITAVPMTAILTAVVLAGVSLWRFAGRV